MTWLKGDGILFSVLPEAIEVHTEKPDVATNLVEARVELLTFTGALTECLLRSGDEHDEHAVHFEVKISGLVSLKDDQKVYLVLPPEACHVYPEKTS